MTDIKIGIIGGSGLYQMEELQDVKEMIVDTPFGATSDPLIIGTLEGVQVAFLARHGWNHQHTPTELPYRANIYALKSIGVEYLFSVSAVGSLQESVKPLDIVIPDQLIDRTKHRISTFFGDGIVGHIGFGHPYCRQLSALLAEAAKSLNLESVDIHDAGTYLCMEGPAFSTLAESNLYRSWGATIIGMTNLPEAKLAREAEIAYATLALVTDYDCWHPDHDHVTVEMVLDNLKRNSVNSQKVILEAVRRLQQNFFVSEAHSAFKYAVFSLDRVPGETKEKLQPLLTKYL